MTAKQYLQQSFRLNAKIDADLLEVERLRALATSVSSPDLSQDRVQTGTVSDRIGNTVAKIIDLEREINAEIDRFVDLKREIRERIDKVASEDFRIILQKRYLNFQKWEQIAVDLNYTYRHVTRLHGEAIQAFHSLFPDEFDDVLECPMSRVL